MSMVSSLEPLGLRVEQIVPATFANNIDINSELEIKFNSELNTNTIPNSIYLLEDMKKEYIRNNTLKTDDYDITQITLSYKDKTIFIRPVMPLKEDCRYILYIDSKILQDILGNSMLIDYISYFDTAKSSSPQCPVILPENNTILNSLSEIKLTDIDCDRYCIQISKQKDFENVVLDEIVDGPNIKREFNLEDGLYYIRAKDENAEEYGEASIFSIKSYKNTSVSDQDLDEDFVFQKIEEDELLIKASYPENETGLVNVKSNAVYTVFNRILNDEDIDFYESSLTGELYDDTDSYMADNLTEKQLSHGDVDGHYLLVDNSDDNDREEDETYVIFVPEAL